MESALRLGLILVILLTGVASCVPPSDETKPNDERQEEQLATLGYLTGYEPAPERTGVTLDDTTQTFIGYNLYTSGHEQAARLIDMDGELVHRWSLDFRTAFSRPPAKQTGSSGKFPYWRRVHPFPNGDLLAIVNFNGMIKIDRDSNLIWAVPLRFHHDLHVGPDGIIHSLTYRSECVPWIHETRKLRVDYITVLSPDGEVIREIPLLEAFRNSSYRPLLRHLPKRGDILHTNTIEVFDGSQAHRSPLFRKGNILVSLRSIDVIAIVDPDRETVVWALSGQWRAQHQPTLLPNGRFLLFDNRGHNGMSKVIEFDPFTQEIHWAFEGDEENHFHTHGLGAGHRLANGNTLLVESNSGRVFEVTPEQEVVWEYINPAKSGPEGTLVATIFDMIRLEPSFPLDWLDRSGEN